MLDRVLRRVFLIVHVEGEGNRCHEIYCDTFSVNISAEVEEVAALFLGKIIPVSAGTPQEVSFVETAHRTIAGRSRVSDAAWCASST